MHNYMLVIAAPGDSTQQFAMMIDSPTKLDEIAIDQELPLEILYGVTPAAPNVMTQGVGKAVGEQDAVRIESTVLSLSLPRNRLLDNPIIWSTVMNGQALDVPITYEWIED